MLLILELVGGSVGGPVGGSRGGDPVGGRGRACERCWTSLWEAVGAPVGVWEALDGPVGCRGRVFGDGTVVNSPTTRDT